MKSVQQILSVWSLQVHCLLYELQNFKELRKVSSRYPITTNTEDEERLCLHLRIIFSEKDLANVLSLRIRISKLMIRDLALEILGDSKS